MSYDQKPARIKLVSSGSPARAAESGAVALPAEEQSAGNAETVDDAEAGRGWSVMSVIIFIVGCAMGGVALAALPHLAL